MPVLGPPGSARSAVSLVAHPLVPIEDHPVLIIAGHVEVDAAHRDQVVATLQDVVRRARLAPGCLDAAITADPLDPTRVNNLERWESAEHLDQWRAVAHAPDIGVAILSDHTRLYDVTGERSPFD